jgi:tetratricopeptide (TPR) repeat protein
MQRTKILEKAHGIGCFRIFTIAALVAAFFSVGLSQGNTVSGHVFGLERRPIADATVELLDEFSRTVARSRTNSSGRYFFGSLPPGNYVVRVTPMESEYDEAEQPVPEIVNFTRETASGQRRLAGFANEQVDLYLKLRKGISLVNEAIFVQQVPPQAKELYERAISDIEGKKVAEGLSQLKAAIEAFPTYYAALERLGNEYVKQGHYEASQILLSAAVQVNPRGHRAWYGLAYSLKMLNRPDLATDAARRSVELYDRSAEYLLLFGELLRDDNKFEEAEKRFLRALEVSRGSLPIVHWYLALLYGNNFKRYADAAKQLRLFLKAQPDTKDAAKIKLLIDRFEEKARSVPGRG